MSSFYKMDPAAWDFGTAGLSLEEEAAYLRVVNAIHKHDAPVPNIDRVLAGMFRCSTRKARALIDALVAAGKLTIEDGSIWNERARSDMVHRQFVSSSSAVRGSKGGRTRAENAAKGLKDNNQPQAVASSRIEENRIEEGGGGSAQAREPKSPPSDDHDRVLSAAGVDVSKDISGKWFGSGQKWHVDRWRDLGLSLEEILEVLTESRPRNGPPGSLAYFDEPMRRAAGRKQAAPLAPAIPIDTGAANGQRPSRREQRSDASLRAFLSGA